MIHKLSQGDGGVKLSGSSNLAVICSSKISASLKIKYSWKNEGQNSETGFSNNQKLTNIIILVNLLLENHLKLGLMILKYMIIM